MAEVLAPIGSTSTMTILHTQDAFQSPQQSGLTAARRQLPRNSMYNTQVPAVAYRRPTSVPISPYAFQATPQLRQDLRPGPAPAAAKQPMNPAGHHFRPPYHDSSASSTSSNSSASNRSFGSPYAMSKDDSVLGTRHRHSYVDPRTSHHIAGSLSTPDLSLPAQDVAKTTPDRYKRNSRNMENIQLPSISPQEHEPSPKLRPVSAPFSQRGDQRPVHDIVNPKRFSLGARTSSFDETGSGPNATRYKRRSVVGKLDTSPAVQPVASPVNVSVPTWSQVVAGKHNFTGPLPPPVQPVRPQHARSSSYGETKPSPMARPAPFRHSTYGPSRSPLAEVRPKSPLAEARPRTAPSMPNRPKSIPTAPTAERILPERPSTANPTLKASDSFKDISSGIPPRPQTSGSPYVSRNFSSPAVQQLSALSDRVQLKGVRSRLRRAFSFSSSSELRKATAENNMAAERAKMRKEKFDSDKQVNEDASVAANQEAGGLGESIYTHQGGFVASTDNISISSTASSASIMLRKMGKGMKKSTRNLRNLFRPKSMIDTDKSVLASGEPNTATAEVALVTVEAERERVNVNLDPHDKPGGGTGYPKLERNSLDMSERPGSPSSAPGDVRSRKSIVGGDRERAEVLAAVRKGILKRGPASLSSSPTATQNEIVVPGEGSAPTTPAEGFNGEYFAGINPHAHTSTRSLPTQNRNISFNNKVQFFDVWSSSEYDRRGDIATCNRLTPMLAQQIKEELNTFKMEMEVHEDSKPHTHFF